MYVIMSVLANGGVSKTDHCVPMFENGLSSFIEVVRIFCLTYTPKHICSFIRYIQSFSSLQLVLNCVQRQSLLCQAELQTTHNSWLPLPATVCVFILLKRKKLMQLPPTLVLWCLISRRWGKPLLYKINFIWTIYMYCFVYRMDASLFF